MDICLVFPRFDQNYNSFTGGGMYLNPNEFMSFCGTGNTLHLDLDSMNTLAEIDEGNNKAKIENIEVTCAGKRT